VGTFSLSMVSVARPGVAACREELAASVRLNRIVGARRHIVCVAVSSAVREVSTPSRRRGYGLRG
jgi:hypothetical protein